MRISHILGITIALFATGLLGCESLDAPSMIPVLNSNRFVEDTVVAYRVSCQATASINQPVTVSGLVEGAPSWAKVLSSYVTVDGFSVVLYAKVRKDREKIPLDVPEANSPTLAVSATFVPPKPGQYVISGREGVSQSVALTVN